ncbi:AsmA-like C-terminal domain-containing protein [Sulfurospirillum sp. T05]|uniref:AsmA-like C-terminal domain-containing protein n=1 Tax=Sulfurospirillum tamanense TaxID=2813362 RepID=A0ABS2WS01_9BACT|nr:AsmA-like C-terminal domain-containing protein [Sulfurospirillum tamanensis]MBN2964148.1 AsmA-like C-terminal domain-containing protein [Sulfurospirillum tamanensis]
MKKAWTPLLVFFVLCIAFLATLFYGIRISSLSIGGVYVDQLYIKLDKKLIVSAHEVRLNKTTKQENSREELVAILKYLPWMNRFFYSIAIENLRYEDEHIVLRYHHDVFYLDSDYVTIDATLNPLERGAAIGIKKLLLKDFDLELYGTLDLDILTQSGFFQGNFTTHGITGSVGLRLEDMLLSYVAQTHSFKNLAPFMEALDTAIDLEKEVSEWIYQKITASHYQIDALKGKIDLLSGDFFPHQMEGSARAKEVNVTFHPSLPPAVIKNLGVQLSNNQLIFHINDASYEGVDVSQSEVYIYNLLTEKNGIVVTLKTQTQLNETIHRILEAYEITIPLTQTSGTTQGILSLDIRFLPYSLKAKGDFLVQDATIDIAGVPFYSREATIALENTTLTLRNAHLRYEDILDVTLFGTVETTQGTFEGKGTIERLHIGHQDKTLVSFSNIPSPLSLDFSTANVTLFIPALATSLDLGEKESRIALERLSLLYPHSPLLQESGFLEGKTTVITPDFKTFAIDLDITKLQTLLYENGKPLDALRLTIHADQNKTLARAQGLSFSQTAGSQEVTLDGLDIGFSSTTPHQSQTTQTLHGTNSHLLLVDQNQSLPFVAYTLENSPKGIWLSGAFAQGELTFLQTPTLMELSLIKANATLVNHFAKKEMFDGGNFELTLKGESAEFFSGSLAITESYLKEMVAYNNLIALANTLPSLALFKGPGFNERGYEIKEGNIVFSQKDEILTLHTIHLIGTSADIIGEGSVNLNDETLHVTLKLKTLKDISHAIGQIPLLNHLILGEDQSIATAISIQGDLKNPVITTQVLQDTLMTPYNIIKRTLQLPFKIFD